MNTKRRRAIERELREWDPELDFEATVHRKWPHLRNEHSKVVAFIHWDNRTAKALLEGLRKRRELRRRLVGVVAYRREGPALVETGVTGVDTSSVPPELVYGRKRIPLLALKMPMRYGDELDSKKMGELVSWLVWGMESRNRLPNTVETWDEWKEICWVLACGYMAARSPASVGLNKKEALEYSKWAEFVMGQAFWAPLMTVLKVKKEGSLPLMFKKIRDCLRMVYGIDPDKNGCWRAGLESPTDFDRRVADVMGAIKSASIGK